MITESCIFRNHHDIDFDIDHNGCLVYWDRRNRCYGLLDPAEPISDPELFVGKIGQQNLLPNHLYLKAKDQETTVVTDISGKPVGQPIPHGISAFLFWGTKSAKQDCVESIATSTTAKNATPKNRIYVTQVEHIIKARWTPFFAPLIDGNTSVFNPLHVILVPNSISFNGSVNASDEEVVNLASKFIRWV